MTSVAKSTIDLNTTLLVDATTADAADVSVPLVEAEAQIKTGNLSVSDSDTHVKKLDDALTVAGSISKTIQNPSGDENIRLALVAKLESFITLLTADGKITVSAIDSDGAPSGHAPLANGSDGVAWGDPGAGAGGSGAEPVDITVTAGETLNERDFVYLDTSDDRWYRIDTDAVPVKLGRVRGCVVETGGIASGATGGVRMVGEVTGFSGLTAWDDVYAATTPGGYAQSRPDPTAGGGQIAVLKLGVATSTSAVLLLHEPVLYMARNGALANNGTLTVVHHEDAQGYKREARAYVSTTESAITLTEYTSGNQDDALDLQGPQAVATYGADQTGSGTASASSTSGGFPASNAVDDDTATVWASSNSSATRWTYDFGVGITKTIVQYTLTDGSNSTQMIRDWTFEGSNDNSTWDVLDTQSSETGWSGANEERTYQFSNNIAYRYYRLDITANNGGSVHKIAEIEMMEAATFTPVNEELAQSFEIASASDIATVQVYLRKVGAPTGDLTIEIQTDSAGEPSGTAVSNGTSTTVAASTLTTGYSTIDFTFATDPALSATTTYWLVLKTTDTQSDTDYVQWGVDVSTPGYSDGAFWSFDGSAWNDESADGIFAVLADGTTFSEPVSMGRWSGGTRDTAVQYGDGAGANATINTTFKNTSGSALDITCVVELM